MMRVVNSGGYPDGRSFWDLECDKGHTRTVVQTKAPEILCRCERPAKPQQAQLFGGAP
jgi:hypothetical protein